MTEIIMPKMGDGMEEGTLLEWLKKEGEKVKSGDVIGTIQTDKATLELESPSSGVIAGLLIKAGDTVPVGKPIGALLKDGESLPANWGTGGSASRVPEAESAASAPAAPEAKAETPAPAPSAPAPTPVATPSPESQGRIKASPLARKIASSEGIDLGSIQGSGPGGRIVEADVRKASSGGARPAAPAAASVPAAADRTIQINRLRQITAQRTQQSKQQVPHFYVTVEVDCERMVELRQMFEEDGSGKVTINDFVVAAVVKALQDMPQVNATFSSPTTVTEFGAVHVGLAVALDDGLTVPVIKNAHTLSLRQLSERARELAKKARENKLHPDELSGSTFSISNMGMLNVDVFAAIINQPNAGILAIGTAKKTVVVNSDEDLEVRTRMNITGSFDHRVVDGAVGAKFVNAVRDYLENPTRLLS